MALNGIILYFPMGAGGNLVKNILNLDTVFEFIDDKPFNGKYPTSESRYNFLKQYYLRPVTSDNWLDREWLIRKTSHNKYFYMNGVGYWNPNFKLVYDIHGSAEEIMSITLDQPLKNFDRSGIIDGRCEEQISSWTIQECEHVFLLAEDLKTLMEIYASKNYALNKNHIKFNPSQLEEATRQNNYYAARLKLLSRHLETRNRRVMRYSAELLFRDNGFELIEDIKTKLGLTIPSNYIRDIHSLWLTSTRELYYTTHNKPLDI